MPKWLRWLVVLPAAIGSFVLLQMVVDFSSERLPLPTNLRDFYSQGINSIVGPWAFVFVGAKTAPKGKGLPTAIVLGVLLGTITGGIMARAIFAPDTDVLLWWLLVSGAVSVVTVVMTCFQIQREEASAAPRTTTAQV